MRSALNILIRMFLVIGVLLMLAFDKFPKDNQLGVTQQNFLLALVVLVFLYYFSQLSETPSQPVIVSAPPSQQPIIVNTPAVPSQ